jgi:lysophospholipase L1-like esterase
MRALALLATAVATAALVAPAARAASPSRVLVVGDSLEVGTGPYLRVALAPAAVAVDARQSRPSPDGLRALRTRLTPADQAVVFDLGVNDDPGQPARLAADLAAARALAGDRCLVVATLARPPVGGRTIAAMNRVVEAFVAATPRARLADWHALAARAPGILAPDGVHATPAGYAARARLVARAVRACGSARRAHRRRPAPPPATGRAGPVARLPDLAPIGRQAIGLLAALWRVAKLLVGPVGGLLQTEPVLGAG